MLFSRYIEWCVTQRKVYRAKYFSETRSTCAHARTIFGAFVIFLAAHVLCVNVITLQCMCVLPANKELPPGMDTINPQHVHKCSRYDNIKKNFSPGQTDRSFDLETITISPIWDPEFRYRLCGPYIPTYFLKYMYYVS